MRLRTRVPETVSATCRLYSKHEDQSNARCRTVTVRAGHWGSGVAESEVIPILQKETPRTSTLFFGYHNPVRPLIAKGEIRWEDYKTVAENLERRSRGWS